MDVVVVNDLVFIICVIVYYLDYKVLFFIVLYVNGCYNKMYFVRNGMF